MNYDKVLSKAVNRKWPTPDRKEWWWTKFSAARRARTRKLSEAQNHRCAFCSRETYLSDSEREDRYHKLSKGLLATLEHVIPQAQGGTDSPANGVMSCHECNSRRGTMDAWEFFEVRSDPKKWLAHLSVSKKLMKQIKEKTPEMQAKKESRREMIAYELAVACFLDPDFKVRFDAVMVEFTRRMNIMAPKYAKASEKRNKRRKTFQNAVKAANG